MPVGRRFDLYRSFGRRPESATRFESLELGGRFGYYFSTYVKYDCDTLKIHIETRSRMSTLDVGPPVAVNVVVVCRRGRVHWHCLSTTLLHSDINATALLQRYSTSSLHDSVEVPHFKRERMIRKARVSAARSRSHPETLLLL